MVDWVIARQFIDFTLLLPSNIDKLPKILSSQQNLSGIIRTEMTAIRTFGDWTEAWAAYLGIFSKKVPSKVPDLIAYFLLISKVIRDNPDCGWLAYDKILREKAANDASLVWSAADPSLWVTHMLSRASTSRSRFSNSNICYLFNHNQCFYKICKFRHVCLYCHSKSHPGRLCPKKKRIAVSDKPKRSKSSDNDAFGSPPRKKSHKWLVPSTVVNRNQRLLFNERTSNKVKSSIVDYKVVRCNSNQPAILPPVSSVSPYNFLVWLNSLKNCPSEYKEWFL